MKATRVMPLPQLSTSDPQPLLAAWANEFLLKARRQGANQLS